MAGQAEDSQACNTLRIMITTDNHLGVAETDPIRKNDSFEAFDEVLQKASDTKVDLVLLGGDLFHDNKPTRNSIVKAIASLKKHCLKRKQVEFAILSDKVKAFAGGGVNYEDPSLAVGLPVFTIHGNHDDPTGADNLSAVDILSSCGLVNYFGKVFISAAANTGQGSVDVSPILMTKGTTKVALYGLGNIRDERLGRMFNTAGSVNWVRPADTPGFPQSDWFNIFILHQNRVQHGPQAKNCVMEHHLPQFLDVVIWGHEHECKPEAETARNQLRPGSAMEDYDDSNITHILQPGSTVVTSLSEGEAARKHCFVLEVREQNWRIQKYALDTQRPFVYDTACLKDVTRPAPLKAEDQEGITAFLETKVNDMISRAAANRTDSEGTPLLPLIRLKIDYTGFTTINAQRFGQKFVGKVANPNDMLTWTKAATRRVKDEGASSMMVDADLLRPEALDQARIEDLITENLQEQLKLLKEEELGKALHEFVEKDEKGALADCVVLELQARLEGKATRSLLGAKELQDEELKANLLQAAEQDREDKATLEHIKQKLATARAGGSIDGRVALGVDDDLDASEGGTQAAAVQTRPVPTQAATGRGRGRGRKAAAEKPAGRGRGRGAAASKQIGVLEAFARASQQVNTQPQAIAPSAVAAASDDAIQDDDAFLDDVPAPKARGRAAAGAVGSRAKRGGAQSGTRKRGRALDSDDADDLDEEPAVMDGSTQAATASGRPSRRATRTTRTTKRTKLDDDDDDDDDDDADADDDDDDEAMLSDDADDDFKASSHSEEEDDDEEDGADAISDSEEEVKPKKAAPRKRATPVKKATAGSRTRASPRGKAAAGARKGAAARTTQAEQDAIVISSDDGDENHAPQNGGRPLAGPSKASLGSAAGGAGRGVGAAGSSQQVSGATQAGTQGGARVGGRMLPGSFSAGPSQSAGTQRGARAWGQAR